MFPNMSNRFDAGPSLWAGMSEPGTNPLRQILDVLEEEVREASPIKPKPPTFSLLSPRSIT